MPSDDLKLTEFHLKFPRGPLGRDCVPSGVGAYYIAGNLAESVMFRERGADLYAPTVFDTQT